MIFVVVVVVVDAIVVFLIFKTRISNFQNLCARIESVKGWKEEEEEKEEG